MWCASGHSQRLRIAQLNMHTLAHYMKSNYISLTLIAPFLFSLWFPQWNKCGKIVSICMCFDSFVFHNGHFKSICHLPTQAIFTCYYANFSSIIMFAVMINDRIFRVWITFTLAALSNAHCRCWINENFREFLGKSKLNILFVFIMIPSERQQHMHNILHGNAILWPHLLYCVFLMRLRSIHKWTVFFSTLLHFPLSCCSRFRSIWNRR